MPKIQTIDCGVRVKDFRKGMKGDEFTTIPSKGALNIEGTFTFEYTYPLSTTAKFEHQISKDMSAQDILSLARKDYERIYKEEDADVGKKTKMMPGMLNRQRSAGRYGIWGHVIDDLFFEGIDIHRPDERITFGMGS